MDCCKFEEQMTRIIPSFAGFTAFTPAIPKMYWDVKSQEQRIFGLCKMLNKVICYADMLGENVDEIAKTLQDILDGKLDELIIAAISQWFEDNEPEIMQDIEALQESVSDIESTLIDFTPASPVKDAISAVEGQITDGLNGIQAEIGTGFDAENTIADKFVDDEQAVYEFRQEITPAVRDGVQVRTTKNVIEYVDDHSKLVANPLYSVQAGEASMANPLPVLYALNSYRNATTLLYGNDYTATNIRTDGTWEPAVNHQDANGKMNIDCTTLVMLASLGILYNSSTYNGAQNIGHSYFIDMFNDVTAQYIAYEADIAGEAVQDRYRRLLASEFAKLLYDRGMLTAIYNPERNIPNSTISLGALKGQIAIGDVLFHSNTNAAGHWEQIGHCSIVVGESDDNIIICDANLGRGNTPVRYAILDDYNQIKWKWTPHQCVWPSNGVGGYTMHASTANATIQQTFAQAGYCVLYNPSASKAITLEITYPNIATPQTVAFTLGQNSSYLIVLPAGAVLKINNAAATTLNVKICLTPFGINPEPYIV